MADSRTEQVVDRLLQIQLKVMGSKVSQDEINRLKEEMRKMVTTSQTLGQQIDVTSRSVSGFGTQSNQTAKQVGAFGGSVNSLERSVFALQGTVRSLLSPLHGLAGLVGATSLSIGGAIEYNYRYSKSLLEISGSWAKYGVGTKTFDKALKDLSNTLNLTREQTLGLMKSYERGFNTTSVAQAQTLFTNLRKAVGANNEAMQEMLGTLSSIVQKFPDLERSITNLQAGDRSRLSLLNQAMVLTGQISLSEAKRLQDYLNGNAQQTQADKKRKAELEAQIDAINDMKRTFEKMAFEIAKGVMPLVQELSRVLKNGEALINDWIAPISHFAAILGGVLITAKALSTLTRIGSIGVGLGVGAAKTAGRGGSAVSRGLDTIGGMLFGKKGLGGGGGIGGGGLPGGLPPGLGGGGGVFGGAMAANTVVIHARNAIVNGGGGSGNGILDNIIEHLSGGKSRFAKLRGPGGAMLGAGERFAMAGARSATEQAERNTQGQLLRSLRGSIGRGPVANNAVRAVANSSGAELFVAKEAGTLLKGGVGAALKTAGIGLAKSLGKGAIVGLLTAGAEYGLGRFQDSQEEKGNKKTAAGIGLGKSALGVAGYALTGATIGSIFPGLGSAIGAALGGAVGIAMNAKEIWKDAKTLIGSAGESAEKWASSSVETVKGWFGMSDADKKMRVEQSAAYQEWKNYSAQMSSDFQKIITKANATGDTDKAAVFGKLSNANQAQQQLETEKLRRVGAGEELSGYRFEKLEKATDAAQQDALNAMQKYAEKAAQDGSDAAANYWNSLREQMTYEFKVAQLEIKKAKEGGKWTDDEEDELNDAKMGRNQTKGVTQQTEGKYDQAKAGATAAALSALAAENAKNQSQFKAENLARGEIAKLMSGSSGGAYAQMMANANTRRNLGAESYDAGSAVTVEDRTKVANLRGNLNAKNIGDDEFDRMLQVRDQMGSTKSKLEKDAEGESGENRTALLKEAAKYAEAEAISQKVINDMQDKRAEKLAVADATNGHILSYMNEQRLILESQVKLYESEASLAGSTAEKMGLIGDIDPPKLASAIDEAVDALNAAKETRQQNLDLTRQQLAAEKAIAANQFAPQLKELGVNPGDILGNGNSAQLRAAAVQAAQKAGEISSSASGLDANSDQAKNLVREAQKYEDIAKRLKGTMVSELALRAATNQLQKDQNDNVKKELDLRISMIESAFRPALGLAKQLVSQSELSVQLADAMGAGLAASVDMRMAAVDAISNEIKLQEQEVRQMKDQQAAMAAAGNDTIEINSKILAKENEITQNKIRQLGITKQLREGYISAISAMTAGTGIFTKLMIDQEKNLGVGVKIGAVIQGLRSGGNVRSGAASGYASSLKYSASAPGAIEGRDRGGTQQEMYNGTPGAIKRNVEQLQRDGSRYLDQVRSRGASMQSSAFEANSLARGATLQDAVNGRGVRGLDLHMSADGQRVSGNGIMPGRPAGGNGLAGNASVVGPQSDPHQRVLEDSNDILKNILKTLQGHIAGAPGAPGSRIHRFGPRHSGSQIFGPSTNEKPFVEDPEMHMWKNLLGKRADGKSVAQLRAMYGKDMSLSPNDKKRNALKEQLSQVRNAKQYIDLDQNDRKSVWKEEDRLDKLGLSKNQTPAGRQQMAVWGVKFDREAQIKKELAGIRDDGNSVRSVMQDTRGVQYGPPAPSTGTAKGTNVDVGGVNITVNGGIMNTAHAREVMDHILAKTEEKIMPKLLKAVASDGQLTSSQQLF